MSGDIAVKGNMALVINVQVVPEEEKYARVVLNTESVAEATVAMTLKDNFEQATENDATLANIPLLFGWLYADLAFELKGGLEAKIEGQMSNQIVCVLRSSIPRAHGRLEMGGLQTFRKKASHGTSNLSLKRLARRV